MPYLGPLPPVLTENEYTEQQYSLAFPKTLTSPTILSAFQPPGSLLHSSMGNSISSLPRITLEHSSNSKDERVKRCSQQVCPQPCISYHPHPHPPPPGHITPSVSETGGLSWPFNNIYTHLSIGEGWAFWVLFLFFNFEKEVYILSPYIPWLYFLQVSRKC